MQHDGVALHMILGKRESYAWLDLGTHVVALHFHAKI